MLTHAHEIGAKYVKTKSNEKTTVFLNGEQKSDKEKNTMGTFAAFFRYAGSKKDESKMEEFSEKVRKVFQYAGMMDIESSSLLGKKIWTIRKAEMDSRGIDVCYNYFEDDVWENAGYNCEGNYVWSNKIGWAQFYDAVVAAYTLEEQYTDGVAATMVDGVFVTSWKYVGWLNYLFNENKHIKNFDTWNLFEAFHNAQNKEMYGRQETMWGKFGSKRYAFISMCEIYAVLYGIEEMTEKIETIEKGAIENLAFRAIKVMMEWLGNYVKSEQHTPEEKCQGIMSAIRKYYTQKEDREEVYKELMGCLQVSDSPAVLVKGIAESFDRDFWELWNEIKDVVCRKNQIIYGNDEYYVLPISTQELFGQNPDDMILYWEDDGKLTFSEELWNWFFELKAAFDDMMKDEMVVEKPLRYMIELLEEAEENFYNVFADSDFFEECLENLNYRKYQTLWRLFDKLIHNPELRKEADVIFVPEGPEHEKEGVHYWDEKPRRRLIRSWDIMSHDKKYNKGRMTIRRYLALVANLKLRKKVFGF